MQTNIAIRVFIAAPSPSEVGQDMTAMGGAINSASFFRCGMLSHGPECYHMVQSRTPAALLVQEVSWLGEYRD